VISYWKSQKMRLFPWQEKTVDFEKIRGILNM